MSLFFVDSGSDLSLDQIKKLGIECINQKFAINDKFMEFGSDFDYDKFYSKFKKGVCVNHIPYTEDEYIEIFEPCLKQGDDVIYVHTSSKLIDNHNLISARDKLKSIYPDREFILIDSANISIGQGLVSYDCALLYRKGNSVNEIYDESFEIINSYAMYFACDSLEQLNNNNLIDNNIVSGTALNIKPIMTVDFDGEIELVDKVSGRNKVITKLIELCRQKGKNVVDYPIGIVYTDQKMAEQLKLKIIENFGEDTTILMTRMSPSNASLIGNGVLGISFRVHKKKL